MKTMVDLLWSKYQGYGMAVQDWSLYELTIKEMHAEVAAGEDQVRLDRRTGEQGFAQAPDTGTLVSTGSHPFLYTAQIADRLSRIGRPGTRLGVAAGLDTNG